MSIVNKNTPKLTRFVNNRNNMSTTAGLSGYSPIPKPDFTSIDRIESSISYKKKNSNKVKKKYTHESPIKKNNKFFTPLKPEILKQNRLNINYNDTLNNNVNNSNLSKKLFFESENNNKIVKYPIYIQNSAFHPGNNAHKKLNFNEMTINEEDNLNNNSNCKNNVISNIDIDSNIYCLNKNNLNNVINQVNLTGCFNNISYNNLNNNFSDLKITDDNNNNNNNYVCNESSIFNKLLSNKTKLEELHNNEIDFKNNSNNLINNNNNNEVSGFSLESPKNMTKKFSFGYNYDCNNNDYHYSNQKSNIKESNKKYSNNFAYLENSQEKNNINFTNCLNSTTFNSNINSNNLENTKSDDLKYNDNNNNYSNVKSFDFLSNTKSTYNNINNFINTNMYQSNINLNLTNNLNNNINNSTINSNSYNSNLYTNEKESEFKNRKSSFFSGRKLTFGNKNNSLIGMKNSINKYNTNNTNYNNNIYYENSNIELNLIPSTSNLSCFNKSYDNNSNEFLFFDRNYQIIKTLDEGSFGIVYLCKEINSKNLFAIKQSKKSNNQ